MQFSTAMRHECSAHEIKALNEAMWGVVAELKGLIAPERHEVYKPLTGCLMLALVSQKA